MKVVSVATHIFLLLDFFNCGNGWMVYGDVLKIFYVFYLLGLEVFVIE